ncbi:MAG: hypothetical protein QOE05_2989, partial [Actinomycetota bacterium]|nr:hypothetical protein [Actinomycetota bacterium]
VVDPAGDDRITGNTSTPYSDDLYDSSDLDIVSADIATDAKNLTAVVRLSTLHETDPESPTGRMWELFFVVGEQRYVISSRVVFDKHDGYVYRETTRHEEGGNGASSAAGIGEAKVVLDYARAEVRATAPLSYFTPYTPIYKGAPITHLEAWSYHFDGVGGDRYELPNDLVVDYGSGGAGDSVDSARSTKYYLAGGKSCVVVGR